MALSPRLCMLGNVLKRTCIQGAAVKPPVAATLLSMKANFCPRQGSVCCGRLPVRKGYLQIIRSSPDNGATGLYESVSCCIPAWAEHC